MDNTHSERDKGRNSAFLLALGVALGILGQTLYDVFRAILEKNNGIVTLDSIAGVGAVSIVLLFAWIFYQTDFNSKKNPP